MQHSTLIATCLFNSSMVTSLDVGERIVRNVFDENFNGEFSKWNVSLPTKTAKSIIVGVGRAMRVDVRQFIADLTVISDELEPKLERSSDNDEPAEQSTTSDAAESSAKGFNGRTETPTQPNTGLVQQRAQQQLSPPTPSFRLNTLQPSPNKPTSPWRAVSAIQGRSLSSPRV